MSHHPFAPLSSSAPSQKSMQSPACSPDLPISGVTSPSAATTAHYLRHIEQLQALVQDLNEKLKVVLDNIPIAVAFLDSTMTYQMVSNKWIADYGDNEFLDKSHFEIFPGCPQRWREIYQRALQGTPQKNDSDIFQKLDGTVAWIKWAVQPTYAPLAAGKERSEFCKVDPMSPFESPPLPIKRRSLCGVGSSELQPPKKTKTGAYDLSAIFSSPTCNVTEDSGSLPAQEGRNEKPSLPSGLLLTTEMASKQMNAFTIAHRTFESRLYALQESVSEAVFQLEDKGLIVLANSQACSALGMSCKDVVGSHFSKFIVFGEQSDNPLHEKFCAVDGQKPEPVVLLKEISLLPRDKVGHPVKVVARITTFKFHPHSFAAERVISIVFWPQRKQPIVGSGCITEIPLVSGPILTAQPQSQSQSQSQSQPSSDAEFDRKTTTATESFLGVGPSTIAGPCNDNSTGRKWIEGTKEQNHHFFLDEVLTAVVTDTCHISSLHENVEFVIQVNNDLPPLFGNQQQLTRVLSGLIKSTFQFCKPLGTVILRITAPELSLISTPIHPTFLAASQSHIGNHPISSSLQTSQEDGVLAYFTIHIEISGPGKFFPSVRNEQAFVLRDEGYNSELWMCKQFIESMGGRINYSYTAKSSSFSCDIPLAFHSASRAKKPRLPIGAGEKFLVAHSNRKVTSVIAEIVAGLNFVPLVAHSTLEVQQLIQEDFRHSTMNEPPKIRFLMFDRSIDFLLGQEIKDLSESLGRPSPHIIMMLKSGGRMISSEEMAKYGIDLCFTKPVLFSALFSVLRQYLINSPPIDVAPLPVNDLPSSSSSSSSSVSFRMTGSAYSSKTKIAAVPHPRLSQTPPLSLTPSLSPIEPTSPGIPAFSSSSSSSSSPQITSPLILPSFTTRSPTDVLQSRPKTHPHFNCHVLVAEDDRVSVLRMKKMLNELGCTVDEAPNGEECLRLVQNTPYDLILMDISMPILDGFQATHMIRRLRIQAARCPTPVPIIAMTSHIMPEELESCQVAGMNGFLAKPIRKVLLLEEFSRWLPPDTIVTTKSNP